MKFSNIFLDTPNHRSSHNIATPRIGGIGIFIAISAVQYLYGFHYTKIPVLIALLCLGVMHCIDDLKPLSSLLRLAVQIATGCVIAYYYPQYNSLIVVLLFLVFINAANFADGLNGLLSGSLLIGLSSWFFLFNNQLLLAILGALSGFFFWNFPKGKVFLGDFGSIMLGAIVTIILLDYANGDYAKIVYCIYPFSFLGFDVGFTILRRLALRRNILQPHREHLFQIWQRCVHSHTKVTSCYILGASILSTVLFCKFMYQLDFWLVFIIYGILQGMVLLYIQRLAKTHGISW